MMTCCLDETTGRGIEFPPLTSVDAAWQHPNRINLRAIFSRDMKASAFIQRADQALYAAKAAGRNRVRCEESEDAISPAAPR